MRELQLRNRQRARRLNRELLRRIARALLEQELGLSSYELAIQFISPTKMADINRDFLAHEGSTDVITFDYRQGYEPERTVQLNLAGEIYISVADAVAQAGAFSTTWQEEVIRYIVHGVLHLRGYDDLKPEKRKIMKREENRLVRRLARSFQLRDITA